MFTIELSVRPVTPAKHKTIKVVLLLLFFYTIFFSKSKMMSKTTYHFFNAIRTASRSDETILQVSSRFCLSVSTYTPHLTITPKCYLFTPEDARSRCDEDTAKSLCLDYGLKVTGRSSGAASVAFRDNFSTLESYLRPAVSASEGFRAFPQTLLYTGSISG